MDMIINTSLAETGYGKNNIQSHALGLICPKDCTPLMKDWDSLIQYYILSRERTISYLTVH